MKKKWRKRWVVIAMAAVMTLGPAGMAWADNAHFTYTDAAEDQPDLYVAKAVSAALEGYTIPDAVFTFVLKWDQDGDGYLESAENEIYYVYNEDGTQVYNTSTGSYIFRTDANGRFTLRDGQYARFEWAGQVAYEITELETEDFTQTYPAGGEAAAGTVDAKGTYVTFENLYVPPGGEETGGGTTLLAVRKDIAWPDGYELPDLSDVEFTFRVSIDGTAYANEAYTLYDASMTTVEGTGRTESDGTFSLTGGQLALFSEVPVGVDYQVAEVGMDTGWRAVGTTSYEGATTAPILYAYFTNENAAFVVTKDRADGVVGTEYTFFLGGEDGSPMAEIPYFLYDADGNAAGSGTTGEDGSFSLGAGERAIFTGILEGTAYTVTEEVGEDFSVTVNGVKETGITGTVDAGSIDTWTFVNEELTDITITKYGSRLNTDRSLLGGAEFTAYVLNEAGEWEQVGEPHVTGEDGTLMFENLPAGTYRIVETKTPAGYITAGEPIEVTLPYTLENEIQGALYSDRDRLYYLYELHYTVDNTAVLVMPNTGGRAWILIVLTVCGGAAALGCVYVYRRRHGGKETAR